ncbi:MAG TPA: LysR substrate-binding domain-containing protein [Polyangia bacterium]|nr:LysR substrate-binding domain-containing protein [Polyangia bacterium]
MTATNGLDLNLVAAFVRVVEEGSFTTAARRLGLPKSSVSRRVTALERALRARLLQRSTRKLVLTEAGRLYFERARAALGGLADAGAAVTDLSGEAVGPIRFTAGGDNTGLLANLLAEFLARHPKVQLDVVLTPRRVDLVAEGFDLALRAGPLVDSALVARRLGRIELGLFASRAYLRRAGRPRRVADLAQHRFVLLGEPHAREHLRLAGPSGEESVEVSGPLIVHDAAFAADAILAGVGVGLIPDTYFGWLAKAGLRARGRQLERVLPDHGVVGSELSLVSPPTAYEPTRVGLLRDFLTEKLRPMIQACTLAMEADKAARHAAEERARQQRTRRATRAA